MNPCPLCQAKTLLAGAATTPALEMKLCYAAGARAAHSQALDDVRVMSRALDALEVTLLASRTAASPRLEAKNRPTKESSR